MIDILLVGFLSWGVLPVGGVGTLFFLTDSVSGFSTLFHLVGCSFNLAPAALDLLICIGCTNTTGK